MDTKGDKNVNGVIIAADHDKKLEYALEVLQNIEVFLYTVSFTLDEFKGDQSLHARKSRVVQLSL